MKENMSEELDQFDQLDSSNCTPEERNRVQPCKLVKCVMMSGDSPQSPQESKILPSNDYDEFSETPVTEEPRESQVIVNDATNNTDVDGVEKLMSSEAQKSLTVPECNSVPQVERHTFEMEETSKESGKCESCVNDCIYYTCQFCDCTIL